jgi:peroxiredoxin
MRSYVDTCRKRQVFSIHQKPLFSTVWGYLVTGYASPMDEQLTPLPPGTPAPDFTLPVSRYASVSLNDFRGRCAVLAFYPADWEPVSREQLTLYQEYRSTFQDLRADVLGISTDGIWCHAAFARETGVRFPLLADSDPQGAITRAYGVCLECKEPSSRALFVIDERGLIRWSQAYRSPVNPGVDGILRVLEVMGTISRADQTTDAIGR